MEKGKLLRMGFHFCRWLLIHLLYKDYQTDHKFTLTTFSPTGATITSSGTKKGEFLAADVNTQLKNKNITADIKVDTSSNFFTTITADEPAPGLKTIFCFKVPDQRSGNVEVHYLHDYAAVSSSIGLTVYPTVNFSGVIGTNVASLGTDLSFDTKTGDFIKCNAGVSLSKVDLIASLTFIVFGMLIMYALDPLTTLKARLNNAGKASALVQHEWRPKSFFTVSGEVDTKAIEKMATKRPGGGH
ncbi:mitochondrial outer membrane protein porin of [Salix suchowensis]|nr:mitochondrial outer membrane protein porin of [Salix suchowensis]